MPNKNLIFGMLLLGLGLLGGAFAQDSASPAEEGPSVWDEVKPSMVHGPQTVELRDQAKLSLPPGYGYLPRDPAMKLMEAMGNTTDERFIGLIFPESQSDWFVVMEFESSGYIKDDDAKEWDADELLQSLKDGTEAANKHRAEIGIPPLEVTRWIETPAYEATNHRLIWSAEARTKGENDQDPTINYNTYVLGREGYISLNLITATSTIGTDKPAAHELLAAVAFNEGKRYSDFNASTDKVAAYGLAALVGGVAAKKLGLIALIGAFVAKFAKVIVLAVAGFGAMLAKFFKRRSETGTTP